MMAQLQPTIEPRSIRIPNDQSQDLRQLSPRARKYVRTICDSDFTKRLKDTSSNNDKRVSFSDDTKTHEYPILTGKRILDLENLPGGLTPSANKASPASSILKEDECETHEPPTRRHSFPFAKPKIRALQRLSELVNARRTRRGSSSLQSVTEEDDNENAILDFPEPSSTTLPLRRLSSPEIDLICPFDDRPRRSSRSSETVSAKSRFLIRKGSVDLVKVVSSTVRRLSHGSFSSEGEQEQGSFEGPLWTDEFDLNLPESVRPDLTEIDFLRRTQKEEKEKAERARATEESFRYLAAMRVRVAEEEGREREDNLEIQSEGDFDVDFQDDMYELEKGGKGVEQALRLSTIPEHEEAVEEKFEHGLGVGNGGIKWSIPVY